MAAALQDVKGGMSVREACKLYNLPYETLRRRVTEKVDLECRSGPPTVLTAEEESELASYCVKMADMGFGLSRADVMVVAFKIIEASGRKHPFTDGTAGRAWFDGFKSRHPRLTLRSTQQLSRARALSANSEIISDFFGKLAAVCAKLNLLNKPMNIFNMDETGVTIVHKGGKVVTEMGRKNVWSITSGEKGKTHTILACVSASGFVLPPFMIYPRQRVTENLKKGAIAGTVFHRSDSGWVNSELFLAWLKFFAQSIPPSRPVLLILDGHSSHVSIETIEFARSNEIHILCLPAHTTHILQPLDVGVFKSFKSFYYRACRKQIAESPHRVITTEQIACLVGIAWPQALTPLNIMSGFKKCGIYPLNPGEVTDRQLAPSTVFSASSFSRPDTSQDVCRQDTSQEVSSVSEQDTSQSVNRQDTSFTGRADLGDHDAEYKKKYEEGYDIFTEDYLKWIRNNQLPLPAGAVGPASSILPVSTGTEESTTSSLSDILALPKPVPSRRTNRKPAVNAKASCITDTEVLKKLVQQKEEKEAKDEENLRKKLEKEKKKRERERKKKEKQEEREVKKQEREKKGERQRKKDVRVSKQPKRQTRASVKTCALHETLSKLSIASEGSDEEGEESEAECPGCGLIYGSEQDGEQWVQCDVCTKWWDMTCAGVDENIADSTFVCSSCV